MRVRYQMAGGAVIAECDLTPRQGRERFEELKTKGLCEWAELVAEDEEDGGEYMDVIENFDHIRLARMLSGIIG